MDASESICFQQIPRVRFGRCHDGDQVLRWQEEEREEEAEACFQLN